MGKIENRAEITYGKPCNRMFTRTERALVHKVLKKLQDNSGALREGACFVTAQKAAFYSNDKFLYHEGFFLKPEGPMRHAWNTLSGKLVDFTVMDVEFSCGNDEFYKTYYRVEHTFTLKQILRHNLAIQRWNWMGNWQEQ